MGGFEVRTVYRSEFPADEISGCAKRLDAIVQYHHSGAGYANEHERLLSVAIVEARRLMDDLYRTSQLWGREFPVQWTPLGSPPDR